MGDAKRRLEKDGERITFDCAAVGFRINKTDREAADQREQAPELRAFELTAGMVVQFAFPNGQLDRAGGRIWGAWQDFIDDGALSAEMTRGAVAWLHKHVTNDDVKIPAVFSRWRESLAEYLDKLVKQPAADQAEAISE